MFRLKLNNKIAKNEIVSTYIEESVRVKQQAEKLITDWLDQDSDFDLNSLVQLWESTRKEYGFKLTEETIKFLAISNSVIDTNKFLSHKMKMENTAISIEDFNALLAKMFRLSISNILIEGMTLEQKIKDDIMSRVVAKQFPNKDQQSKNIMQLPKDLLGPIDEPIDKGL